jgi:hypothetical protein
MKKITLLILVCSLLGLAACGKSKLEERIEKDTAISKKMGGDVNKVPRTIMPSEDKKQKNESAK